MYRKISQFHENPTIIGFATTSLGGLLIWFMATLLLLPSNLVFAVSPLLLLIRFARDKRTIILSLGSVWVLYEELSDIGVESVAPIAIDLILILGLLYIAFLGAKSYRSLPVFIQRRPQITLHFLLWIVLLAALVFSDSFSPGQSLVSQAVMGIVILLPFLIWRAGYMLYAGRHGTIKDGRFYDHLFYCLPVFGGSNVPYGKGHDYLAEKRADSLEDFSRTQLAGLKLLFLAWLWTGLREVIAILLYGDVGMRTGLTLAGFEPVLYRLQNMVAGMDLPLHLVWASLLVDFVDMTLDLAVFGHLFIGCLRLFGFNVYRNTYKPLLAQSIVDFWNRFYYYFKELLVDFFFFPVYASFFKKSPKLRIFTATMAAAFIGNSYYHLIRELDRLAQVGFFEALTLFSSYLFYSFLLGLGVFVGLLREQGRRGKPVKKVANPWLAKLVTVRKIAGVWLFFALIRIWDTGYDVTFSDQTAFFFSLFGITAHNSFFYLW